MEKRRRKIILHKIALTMLCTILGAVFFSLIGILFASDAIANSAKVPIEDMECNFCDELIEGIKKEEAEAAAAEKAKIIAEATGIIYLTFDDGPGDYTNALLDVLDRYDVKATFFVTGRGDDAVIKREFDEGHTVALHTWSHNYSYIYSSVDNYFADLSQVADRVKRITGEDAKLIRFPGGSSNTVSTRYDKRKRIMSTLTREVEASGYQYFDWNVDSDDAGKAKTPGAVYSNVISRLKPGPNVVLQHDIKDYSVDAVEQIIKYGQDNNFYFDKLSFDSFTAHHGVNN